MPKTGNFYHEVLNTTDAAVTDAFAGANRHDINLHDLSVTSSWKKVGGPFVGKLEGCICRVKAIAGGTTKITVKVTHAADGTQVIIPDTEATIAFEVGSTTEGGIAIKFDFPYLFSDDQLHFFYKTDAAGGTATIDALEVIWSE
jgi:hypothetical protein